MNDQLGLGAMKWRLGVKTRTFQKEALINAQFANIWFAKISRTFRPARGGKARIELISGIMHAPSLGGRWIDPPPEYGPRFIALAYIRV
jgi:hypothetical protein